MFKKMILVSLTILTVAPVSTYAADTRDYLGRWALHLPGGAGWLSVRQEKGYLDADLLWYGGSVVPVSSVYTDEEALFVELGRQQVRQRNDKGKPTRSHTLVRRIKLRTLGKGKLTGQAVYPNANGRGIQVTEFEATKIADLPAAPNLKDLKYGKPVVLFQETGLDKWTLTNPKAKNGFREENGVLINDPVKGPGKPKQRYGNIRTKQTFEDFRLTLEVNVPKGSNSGIYLRGLYEVQILDSFGRGLDSHHMGAIYSRITPTVSAEKQAGQWQTFDITLCDRHVTVILNGKTIIDNHPLLGVTGGALSADEFSPGPIYLQGDHGKVMFRNILLYPIVK